MKSMYDSLKAELAVEAAVASGTTDIDGETIDLKGFSGCLFVANIGESGDTLSGSVKVELEMEESDDASSWTDCADADVDGYVDGTNDGCWAVIDAAAEDSAVFKAAYRGTKRYVRAVVNLIGTHTNGIEVSVTALKAPAELEPVA